MSFQELRLSSSVSQTSNLYWTMPLLNWAHASLHLLKLILSITCVYMSVSECICPLRLLITIGMMWCDMDCIWLDKQVLKLLCGNIVGRRGLSINVNCRNQTNKNKLELFKHYFWFNSHLKRLYISNKIECISYKDTCIK